MNPLVHSNLNNQAARADNNNTMLRVLKLNLPRLPCDSDSSAQIMMKYQKCDSQHAENLCCELAQQRSARVGTGSNSSSGPRKLKFCTKPCTTLSVKLTTHFWQLTTKLTHFEKVSIDSLSAVSKRRCVGRMVESNLCFCNSKGEEMPESEIESVSCTFVTVLRKIDEGWGSVI